MGLGPEDGMGVGINKLARPRLERESQSILFLFLFVDLYYYFYTFLFFRALPAVFLEVLIYLIPDDLLSNEHTHLTMCISDRQAE